MSNSLILRNIHSLIGIEERDVLLKKGNGMAQTGILNNAWLLISEGKIKSFGPEPYNFEEDSAKGEPNTHAEINQNTFKVIDCTNKIVLPSFCDSHTHLVYAGSREIEYIDKIQGLSYEEIAKRGGGILNSAKRLHETSEELLTKDALNRLDEVITYGTGAIEIKSGYGLNTNDELKMLRVIKKLKSISDLSIKATFLGAHAVPSGFKGRQSDYVDLIVKEMIPRVAEENLADFIDVFCDKGFFTPDETARMLETGIRYGLRPKIHANELDYSGGVQIGVKHNALSVDHLEFTGDDEIEALLNSNTMPTLLPGAAFFLNMIHAPARKMINSGLPLALASDFNPGSSPSGNMQLILSMGCIMFRMLPIEALNACTINGAYAMDLSDRLGSITVGKIANLSITKSIPGIEYLPYYYGSNKLDTVILNGKIIKSNISA